MGMPTQKKLLAITLTLISFLGTSTVLASQPVACTEALILSEYCWIEGDNLDIGFSKYGEMIGYDEASGIGLGLQYPGYGSAENTYDQTDDTSVDPFCNEYIGVDWWWNGWFIDIKYTPPSSTGREIWAFALFSDGQQHGGIWITMPAVDATSTARPLWQEHPPYANPDSYQYAGVISPLPVKGGRKTNGYCETEPIKIIYDGPRKFMALTKTTINDPNVGADLVELTFTYIFNKAEKKVIIIEDIKRLYEESPMNIAFGNRGFWDLGISPDIDPYLHWFTSKPVQYWDTDGDGAINGTEVETTFKIYKNYFLTNKHPSKWWDEVTECDRPTTVYNEWTEEMINFPDTWLEAQETYYACEWGMDKATKEHSYAVAQVISQAGDYVGALAVWPHPEFWTAHSVFPPSRTIRGTGGNNPSPIACMFKPISRMLEWHRWTVEEDPNQGEEDDLEDRDDIWISEDDTRAPDGSTLEPVIPKLIYEHNFELNSTLPEYNMVLVYMLTDRHDGDDKHAQLGMNDEDWSNGIDKIDWDIQDQCVYMPLYSNDYEMLNAYSKLQTDYNNLEENYGNLSANYNTLQREYDALIGDLYTIRNVNYILIAATIIFIATTVYSVMRKTESCARTQTD